MTENLRSRHRLLYTLIGILIVAVIVQSYFLFKLNASITGREMPAAGKQSGRLEPLFSGKTDKKPFNDDWFNQIFKRDEWNPLKEMEEMQNTMNDMFNQAIGKFNLSPEFSRLFSESDYTPGIDIREEKDRYIIRSDIPGTALSDINVEVDGQTLTISGSRDTSMEKDDGGAVIRRERHIGRFSRTVTLPGPVDSGKMKTDYKDGILKIILPKMK